MLDRLLRDDGLAIALWQVAIAAIDVAERRRLNHHQLDARHWLGAARHTIPRRGPLPVAPAIAPVVPAVAPVVPVVPRQPEIEIAPRPAEAKAEAIPPAVMPSQALGARSPLGLRFGPRPRRPALADRGEPFRHPLVLRS